jgi:aryl-alcohol dehydrogenase-like predicted oxidoreductase
MRNDDLSRRDFVKQGALGAAGIALGVRAALAAEPPDKSKILNFNERMEYRRCGKTGLMVSAISLGGHWKRTCVNGKDVWGGPWDAPDLLKNRTEIVSKCIDSGINYLDACEWNEILALAKAVKGRRDKMYFGFSWCVEEMRNPKFRTKDALLATLDKGMKQAELDCVDLWRVSCHTPGRMHTFGEVLEMAAAGEKAVKDGKCRFFGISTHDPEFLELMIKDFPIISVVLMPYTAGSKEKPTHSLYDTIRKCDVGFFGIKPFANNSLFKGDSQPGNPLEKEDNERARLALRYILCNDAITAPIPGLSYPQQVDNCLEAIAERRKLDLGARPAILDDPRLAQLQADVWRDLPPGYQWLRKWECV